MHLHVRHLAELSLKLSVYLNGDKYGETCALCLSILWRLRDQDIRRGFDQQGIWVKWSAATHYQQVMG